MGDHGPAAWRYLYVAGQRGDQQVGIFTRPNVPALPGLDEFEGRSCHTSRWPEDLDLSGRRVAVIGSGCSGYQLMPEIVKDTAHTYLFQRTPSWVRGVPRYLSSIQPQVAWLDRNLPFHTNFVRFRTAWATRPENLRALFTADPEFDDPPRGQCGQQEDPGRGARVHALEVRRPARSYGENDSRRAPGLGAPGCGGRGVQHL